MTKRILYFTFLLIGLTQSQQLLSQEKPGCDPKACGPGDTKIAEAKVITGLRSDLQSVIDKLAVSELALNPELASFRIQKGSSDDESVLFIAQAATFVRTELLARLQVTSILPELRNFKPAPASSKQQLVVNLKEEIQLLSLQVAEL